MKVIFCIGAPVSGKLTTAQELAKLTGYPIYSNHWIRAAITKSLGTYDPTLAEQMREVTLKHIINRGYDGVIIPFCWNFDSEDDWNDVKKRISLFNEDSQVYYVELYAPASVRQFRMNTFNRVIRSSDMRIPSITERENGGRYVSAEGELDKEFHIRIDTTVNTPEAVARKIVVKFGLAGTADL